MLGWFSLLCQDLRMNWACQKRKEKINEELAKSSDPKNNVTTNCFSDHFSFAGPFLWPVLILHSCIQLINWYLIFRVQVALYPPPLTPRPTRKCRYKSRSAFTSKLYVCRRHTVLRALLVNRWFCPLIWRRGIKNGGYGEEAWGDADVLGVPGHL